MKLFSITRKRRSKRTLALASGRDVGYSWSNYEGHEKGDYSVTLNLGGYQPELYRLEMTHEELGRLVKYWNKTEAGTRPVGGVATSRIGP